MQTVIKQYIRDEKKNPRGVAVAVRENGEVFYGFSLWDRKDKYDKDLGLKIAINRAGSDSYKLPKVEDRCDVVLSAYADLQARALRYFKDLDYSKVALNDGFQVDY